MGHGCSLLYLIFDTIHQLQIKLRMEGMCRSLYLSAETSLYLYVASTIITVHVV
jgi:hypothetical protein